ncbi:MAG: OsmC family protein [Cyclobacteriaceae bacterium]|nr:osmotically inducible protein OsmC [Flammeovirgaceae bacterium]MDG1105555.1 OsmC family protein [Cyclobacteriaceae bacterium]|tara:strand:+ start:328 stop:741 length:414 start_codon:yes stop_codon:yes gene_type:complete
MEIEVVLGFKSDEEFYTVNSTQNRVEIDMYEPEKKQAQSPMELLLSGIISCAAVDVVSMIKKRRKVLNGFSGKASGQRRLQVPKSFTEVHIHYEIDSPDLTHQEAEKIISMAVDKYCSVASSINSDIHLSHGFEIKR